MTLGRSSTVHALIEMLEISHALVSQTASDSHLLQHLDVIKHSRVAPTGEMHSVIATAAYLCSCGALPGECMSCAASTDALASFVSQDLGSKMKVLDAPTSVPDVKAHVTIVDFTTGSIYKGMMIVVCHALSFPSQLNNCLGVTGSKVITSTLKPARASYSEMIKSAGICRIDTWMWLSAHPAFKSLNIPRGHEACHCLIDNDLAVVPTMTGTELE